MQLKHASINNIIALRVEFETIAVLFELLAGQSKFPPQRAQHPGTPVSCTALLWQMMENADDDKNSSPSQKLCNLGMCSKTNASRDNIRLSCFTVIMVLLLNLILLILC